MEMIQVGRTDFGKILNTAEILIDEVEQVFQEEVVKGRMEEVIEGRMIGRTQNDYDKYLKGRGIKVK